MKRVFIPWMAASVLLGSATTAFAGGIHWPDIRIPPITDWTIGGTIGQLWEGNKEAIRVGTIGAGVLGPLGLVAGLAVGAKFDIQKRHAQEVYDRMAAEQAKLKAAADAWPVAAQAIYLEYEGAGTFLAGKSAPEVAFKELNDRYLDAGWCLYSAQNATQADDCLFDFKDESSGIQRRYR